MPQLGKCRLCSPVNSPTLFSTMASSCPVAKPPRTTSFHRLKFRSTLRNRETNSPVKIPDRSRLAKLTALARQSIYQQPSAAPPLPTNFSRFLRQGIVQPKHPLYHKRPLRHFMRQAGHKLLRASIDD